MFFIQKPPLGRPVEEEDHARVGRQRLTVHEPDLALLVVVGDLYPNDDLLAAGGLDHHHRPGLLLASVVVVGGACSGVVVPPLGMVVVGG